jgi:hypothetical protein
MKAKEAKDVPVPEEDPIVCAPQWLRGSMLTIMSFVVWFERSVGHRSRHRRPWRQLLY